MYHDCPIISENDDSRDQIFSSVSFAFVKIDSLVLFLTMFLLLCFSTWKLLKILD